MRVSLDGGQQSNFDRLAEVVGELRVRFANGRWHWGDAIIAETTPAKHHERFFLAVTIRTPVNTVTHVLDTDDQPWERLGAQPLRAGEDHSLGDFVAVVQSTRRMPPGRRWDLADAYLLPGRPAVVPGSIAALSLGRPRAVVTQFLLGDEPAWPVVADEVYVRRDPSGRDGELPRLDVPRRDMLRQVLEIGAPCWCYAAGGPCPVDESRGEPEALDGLSHPCAKQATDRELAAMFVALAYGASHFSERFSKDEATPDGVIEAEREAIKKARQFLGLSRSKRGAPRKR